MNVMGLIIAQTQNQKAVPVRINLDRMKSSIASETFVMPKGLSREEKRRLILEAGKNNCHTLGNLENNLQLNSLAILKSNRIKF